MQKEQNQEFVSALETPVQRALSSWLYRAFEGKISTFAGLIEHFSITEVIKKISPKVRGKVLTTCNGGGDAERASKMNAEIVANTIASMLDDKLVTPEEICKEISTDHMVEVLPSQELYRFIFGKPGEQKRWLHDEKRETPSKTFMAQVHKVIQAERLLGEKTASSYMSIIGDEKVIHEKTPARLLASCQIAMLLKNRTGEIWSDEDLLGVYTPSELVEYVDLSDLFPAVESVATLNTWVEVEKQKPGLPDGVVTPSELPPPSPPARNEAADEGTETKTEELSAEEQKELDEIEAEGAEDTTMVAARPDLGTPPPLPGSREAKKRGGGNRT